MTTLPTLDFSNFTQGSQFEREELGKSVTKSFIDHGFVKLINHGLPDETIAELLDLVRGKRNANEQFFFFSFTVTIKADFFLSLGLSPGSSLLFQQRSKMRLCAPVGHIPSAVGAV